MKMDRLSKQLSKAIALAYEAHMGQVDKGGKPYILHPITVAMTLATCGYNENTIVAGVLHDVVEDTHYTLADLKEKGFSSEVIEALTLLTHEKSVAYMDYVERIKTNKIAVAVKQADLLHNSERSRLTVITDKDEERLAKYEQALKLLRE